MDRAQKCSTLPETSPLLLFRLSRGKKSQLFLQVCCMSANLLSTVASMGDWFHWSTSAPLRGAKRAEQHDLVQQWKKFSWGDIYALPYRQLPRQSSLPKILLFVQDVFRLNSDLLSLRFQHNVQKPVQSLYGHSGCSACFILGFSLPDESLAKFQTISNMFALVHCRLIWSLPSRIKIGGKAGYLYNLIISHQFCLRANGRRHFASG